MTDPCRDLLDQVEPEDLTQIALQMLFTIERMELIIPEITDTIRKALEQGRPTPQPVAVSERLPGAKDCALWPSDPEATPWCWAGKDIDGGWEWAQISMLGLGTDTLSRIIAGGGWTHWLPSSALPTPEATNG